jgi:hypothetical protein
MIEIVDCVQGTPEWRAHRCGLITASVMSQVLAKGEGKTRQTLMYKLIGEAITGEPAEGYSNGHTERGHEMEPVARNLYQERQGVIVGACGFIKNHGCGYSPDGLIGASGLYEGKSRLPHLQAALLDADRVPPEHKAQIQAGLWISEREWLDFVSYWPGMPLFVKRVSRDEDYIKNMEAEVKRFYEEMDQKLNKVIGVAA